MGARSIFSEVKELQNVIMMEISDMQSVGSEVVEEELSNQSSKECIYNDRINCDLARIIEMYTVMQPSANAVDTPADSATSRAPISFKLPELKIATFSDNSKDPFEYFRFISTYNNALDSIPGVSKSTRLVYLKSYCRGRALALIENLVIDDNGLDAAISLLESEFLDRDSLVNTTLAEIVNYKQCSCLESNSKFLTVLKAKLAELNRFSVNFRNDNSGNVLMSHIVRSKLHSAFLQELCRKVNDNYPLVDEILEHAVSIYKLLKAGAVQPAKTFQNSNFGNASKDSTCNSYEKDTAKKVASGCKLCSLLNHSTLHCRKYANHEARTKRALSLGLCVRCLSSKHTENSCPGVSSRLPYQCQSCRTAAHVTPMCLSMVLYQLLSR